MNTGETVTDNRKLYFPLMPLFPPHKSNPSGFQGQEE